MEFGTIEQAISLPAAMSLMACSMVPNSIGYSGVRLFGCSGIWLFGYLVFRVFGYSGICLFGYLVIRVFGYSVPNNRITEHPNNPPTYTVEPVSLRTSQSYPPRRSRRPRLSGHRASYAEACSRSG